MGSKRYSARKSSIHGKGLFALKAIAAGEELGEYYGERISRAEVDIRAAQYGDHTMMACMAEPIGELSVVDAMNSSCTLKYANHSCDPNCAVVYVGPRIYLRAIKDVLPGEELTWDYHLYVGLKPTKRLKERFKCLCGASGCRGTMLGLLSKIVTR